jgi:hypothetical protein
MRKYMIIQKTFVVAALFAFLLLPSVSSAAANLLIENITVVRDGEEAKRPIPMADFVEMVMKQVAVLESEIRSLGKVPVNVITVDSNLSVGNSGAEVKELQMLLNTTKAAQVAVSGPGSPGLETNFFGPLTRDAVLRFQESDDSLGVTGMVNEETRNALNALFVR